MDRRDFLKRCVMLGALGAVSRLCPASAATEENSGKMKKIKILLRDFRTVVKNGEVVNFNIGTTAHGPGAAAMLQKFLPECEIRVWASAPLSAPLNRMMARRFPDISIVSGPLSASPAVQEAAHWCDLLLPGPGTSIPTAGDVNDFVRFSSKPFGAAGIGYVPGDLKKIPTPGFLFFRDTAALAAAQRDGLKVPTGFVPDGAFAFDAADEPGAAKFMANHGLEKGRFVCCLPRYRKTPFWEFCPERAVRTEFVDYNRSMVKQDMAPLVEAACRVVREKHWKVLLSPETEPATRLCQNELFSMFPEDVKPQIAVPESFWEADLALGVYRQSRGLFGTEMHSQVMALGSGIPAMVCRTKEFGSKSQMWNDLGLGEWLFDFDSAAGRQRFPEAVMRMFTQEDRTNQLVKQARTVLSERFVFFADFLRKHYGS